MKLLLLSAAVSFSSAFVVRPVSQLSSFRTYGPPLRAEAGEELPPFLEEKTVTKEPEIDNAPQFGGLTKAAEGFELPDIGGVLGKLDSFDLSAVTNAFGSLVSNISDGEFGTRGESYTLAKLAVIVCILGGGVPFVGDFLMVLLGPGLIAAGLGVIVVAFQGLGEALSPWPMPASTSEGVVKDGIYGKMRHPFYAGILATCAGLSIMSGSATRLLLTAALLYVVDVVADYEEEELTKKFADYESYQKEVPGKFFPQDILDELPWAAKE